MKDLIKFPSGEEWEDTGEGGLAVFFILLENNRQKCIAGDILFPCQDVVLSPHEFARLNDKLCKNGEDKTTIDLGMLVASTKEALWNEVIGEYFQATEKDLTEQGRVLYDLLVDIYEENPKIVTLLDT